MDITMKNTVILSIIAKDTVLTADGNLSIKLPENTAPISIDLNPKLKTLSIFSQDEGQSKPSFATGFRYNRKDGRIYAQISFFAFPNGFKLPEEEIAEVKIQLSVDGFEFGNDQHSDLFRCEFASGIDSQGNGIIIPINYLKE